MKLQGSCDSALGVAIDPFERLGLGVVVADVAHDLAFKVGLGGEDPSGDQVALDLGVPDFDLVEQQGEPNAFHSLAFSWNLPSDNRIVDLGLFTKRELLIVTLLY
tara:strand:- start:13 stop:327 length:315 start_codon:yes stop_codon:yes gene_type:complete